VERGWLRRYYWRSSGHMRRTKEGQMTLVALTGATGFIGRQLLSDLQKRGVHVRVLLRRPAQIPLDCDSAVIGDLARPQNLTAAFRDADAVVHSAGIAPGMSGMPQDDYRAINTEATGALAQAAERAGVRRFVFMSSIRAQCGPSAQGIVTEATPPQPADAYGKSKLAGEHALAKLGMDWVALRPVLVYGPGVQGNMAALSTAARSPYPLPLGGLTAQRSLLALDNLVDAVAHVLATPAPLRRAFIVSDAEALSVSEMIAAMRAGLGRRPGLMSVPTALLKLGLRRAGKTDWFERLCEPLVASSASLQAIGWSPRVTTPAGLAALMRAR
jgi:nucleoside-diphosphate-sugar epimerase